MCSDLIAFRPDIVVTEKGVSDLASHYFVKAGITCLRRVKGHICGETTVPLADAPADAKEKMLNPLKASKKAAKIQGDTANANVQRSQAATQDAHPRSGSVWYRTKAEIPAETRETPVAARRLLDVARPVENSSPSPMVEDELPGFRFFAEPLHSVGQCR
jgi:hypothetical protein